MTDRPATAEGPTRARLPHLGLSGKLLVLTTLFVMIAEVLIYVPSIANFRLNWLHDRLSAAYTAALVFEVAPSGAVPENVARQVLDSIGARAVALKMGQQRRLLAVRDMPPAIHHDIDMRDMSWYRAIIDAFDTLLCADDDVMRVVGPAPMGGEFVEIVLDEKPLRKAMVDFSIRILILSLIISGITATLVYLALHQMFVRPLRRITANMTAFHEAPENPARIIVPSARQDEVGTTDSTRLSDYGDDTGDRVGALVRVHKANYRITGFTESASLAELSELARRRGVPLVDDLGSGALDPIADEPTVQESLGLADLVLFSGDKLLGGPQAGIVLGRADLVRKLARHPLARALRIDKMTMAALEVTLRERLLERPSPLQEMLAAEPEALRRRAGFWMVKLADRGVASSLLAAGSAVAASSRLSSRKARCSGGSGLAGRRRRRASATRTTSAARTSSPA